MKTKSRIMILLVVAALTVSLFSGCGLTSSDDVDATAVLAESVEGAIATANSVESSIYLEMQARVGSSGTTDSHTASLSSDITITSTFAPRAYYSEYFSRILVDGKSTREDSEIYVVPDETNPAEYIRYEYAADIDNWTQQTLTREEGAAMGLKSGLMQDWEGFFGNARLESEATTLNNKVTDMYVGKVDASVIQEIIGDKVFGSFLYSVEQLLNDEIECTVYIEQETYLPVQLIIDFSDEFVVSDMIFDLAMITVDYSGWGETGEISVPKKVSVVATDPNAEFYATYFAWNLFMPYLNGDVDAGSTTTTPGLSFTSSWNNFQIRIDNGLTTLPITYADLNKLGYVIDDGYDTIIIEPNMYVSDVPVYKGRDLVYCSFFNDTTEAQPIINCKIGSFDIAAGDQYENSIKVYLPGEVCLGMTKESLIAAYGEPTTTEQGFSSDTLIWREEGKENQSFLAEISPVSGQIIRLQLKNIIVTGGKQ